jgi:hypothetical protein
MSELGFSKNGFAESVAKSISEVLKPFDNFGIQVNVAVFFVGRCDLHVLAHLDRLPIINRTMPVKDLSFNHAADLFLSEECVKLKILYELIDADPHALLRNGTRRSPSYLQLVR